MGLVEWMELGAIGLVVGVVYILRAIGRLLAELEQLRRDVRELREFTGKEIDAAANALAYVIDHPAESR